MTPPETQAPTATDRLLVELLRQAPYLPSADDLGVASCPVIPWPHQLRVVREAVRRYPESFLFADEVGLGKTIEAGLVLRQLVLSGRVRRALVLVPKALLRQWQEELHEKMVLRVPRFEGGRWLDVADREVFPEVGAGVTGSDVAVGPNPWNGFDLALASTQLARRRERRDALLTARPWDLVIVDEAHHARRRGLATDTPRPNLLLELLAGDGERPGLVTRTRCLYLLTATPMQVHPLEAFDLLRLLGLGGRWGSRGADFLRYFEEIRRPFPSRDWAFLLPLVDEMAAPGSAAAPAAPATPVAPVAKGPLATVLDPEGEPTARHRALAALDPDARLRLDAMLRQRTPFETFAFRHTRDLLRRYQRRGLLAAKVPERRPENIWIDLRPQEAELYHRIEDTLGELYRRYEARRRGLGFVMTLYRRRLTSSFAAMRRSLERRLEHLVPDDTGLFDDDELPETRDTTPDLFAAVERDEERRVLGAYLEALRRLPGESKLGRLRRDLAEWVAARGKVLVFTQYTDTLDFLRDQLVGEYDGAVGCFSGRGGERWDGSGWQRCSKEDIKEAFREGDTLRVLLCTEAAGEGLNLQTCGALINFDMPWNPMRVEQRIGRIDRIGQQYDEVWVRNYFYRDTVEAVIYQRLAHRIAWFEQVVGTLQPILHRVEESIEQVALAAGNRRQQVLDEEVERLERELEQQQASPALDDVLDDRSVDPGDPTPGPMPSPEAIPTPPLDWRQLETTVLGLPALARHLEPDPGHDGLYHLTLGEERHRVTFSPEQYDRRPYTLRLLTWGEPLFDALLATVEPRPERDKPGGIGLYRTSEPQPMSLFLAPVGDGVPGRGGAIEVLPRLEDLRAALTRAPGPWPAELEGEAASRFSRERAEVLRHRARIERQRHGAERQALLTSARRVLLTLAHIELAQDRNPGLFDQSLGYGFGARAIRELARHGAPYPWLIERVTEGLEAAPHDPEASELEFLGPGALERRRRTLDEEARELATRFERLETSETTAELALREPSAGGILERWWFPLAEAAPELDEPFERLDPEGVRPFRDAVPLYADLAETAQRFADPETLRDPQADERRRPADFTWVCSAPRRIGRLAPERGLFVVPLRLRALDRRLGDGAYGLFRLAPHRPRPGALLLVAHPNLDDPELGPGVTLRHATLEPGGTTPEGDWQPARLLLDPDSNDPAYQRTLLEDLEDEPPVLVAELVEIL